MLTTTKYNKRCFYRVLKYIQIIILNKINIIKDIYSLFYGRLKWKKHLLSLD